MRPIRTTSKLWMCLCRHKILTIWRFDKFYQLTVWTRAGHYEATLLNFLQELLIYLIAMAMTLNHICCAINLRQFTILY